MSAFASELQRVFNRYFSDNRWILKNIGKLVRYEKADCLYVLVGPCSLDYSKAKTPDHLWTDPHAEELVMKHNIHSSIGYNSTAASNRAAGKFSGEYDSPFRSGGFGSLHRKKPALKNAAESSS